jgi:HAD superfamily hydrolase (TIGR01509 family)
MIEAVIFDMDGVLLDSEPLHQEATRRMLAGLGVAVAPGEVEDPAFVGLTDPEIFAVLRVRHRLAPDVDELSRSFAATTSALVRDRAAPMAGVPAVLHALRAAGNRLAVASSSSPELIAATLETLGIRRLFEVVVSGLAVGRGKPAPDVFLETAKRLGVAPAACLVVEDSRNGILAAASAGMRRVAIPCPTTRGHDFTEADLVLDSLPSLLAAAPSLGLRV